MREPPRTLEPDRPLLGRLIAIEGGEGAGKSTQAVLLASSLGAEMSREPGGSALGERIRGLLLDPAIGPIAPRTELMMMLAARAEHVADRLRPWLETGVDVVVDRYSGSTLAYQGYGRGLPVGELRVACDLATGGIWPDVTILLDVPLETGAARRAGSSRDRIESEEGDFHERVRRGYLELAAEEATWIVIDGSAGPEAVAVQVIEAVRQGLS